MLLLKFGVPVGMCVKDLLPLENCHSIILPLCDAKKPMQFFSLSSLGCGGSPCCTMYSGDAQTTYFVEQILREIRFESFSSPSCRARSIPPSTRRLGPGSSRMTTLMSGFSDENRCSAGNTKW